jgi:nitroimidazol reductase NimA-like FMN-containing flavoprotein (pyridoxamine 5'-phosphate oxidase superfamily)
MPTSPNDDGADERLRVLRSVIDANRFMTLATADERGTPWASPVWFARRDERRFLWVSRPTTRHSRNIAARPEVAIVIYDSRTTPDERQAVYIEATVAELEGEDLDSGLSAFSRESLSQGLSEWPRERVTGSANFRLYEATATAWFILADGPDERLPVPLL